MVIYDVSGGISNSLSERASRSDPSEEFREFVLRVLSCSSSDVLLDSFSMKIQDQ